MIFSLAATALDNRLQTFDFAIDIATQLAEAEHAKRVADFLQQLELRHKLRGLFMPVRT